MPVDTGIYNLLGRGVKSVQDFAQEDQARLLGAAQLQASQTANLLGKQKADEYSQTVAEKNALRDYMRSSPDLASAQGISGLYQAAPTQAEAIIKTLTEQRKASADARKTELGNDQTQVSQAVQRLASFTDPAHAAGDIDAAVQAGTMPPQVGELMKRTIPADPNQFETWKRGLAVSISDPAKMAEFLKPHLQTNNTGGATVTQAIDPMTGRVLNTSSIANTQSPDSIATNATSRANNAANIAKDYRVAGLDAKGNDSAGTGGLSPAAIENAATRYNIDGTLPPQLGRGNQGARDIRAIQNRAAELSMGVDPGQLRVNQLDAKASGTALTQLTKSKTMAASFEQTANQNADLALSLSKKLDRTGVPILNAGLQYMRTNSGSPEAAQWAAANETFVNEYAKIMSGGMGNGATSDSARAKAHELLTTAMTPQQYEGNVKLLQREMQNRMKGFEDQEKALRSRLSGKPEPAKADSSGVPADIQALIDKHGGKK